MTVTEALEAHSQALKAHKEAQKTQTGLGRVLDAAQREFADASEVVAELYPAIKETQQALNTALLNEQIRATRQ